MRARLGVAAVGVIFLAWGLQSLWLEIPDAASMALAAVGATLVLLSTVPSVVGAAKALFRSGGPDVDARRELTGSDRDPDLLSPRVVLIPGRRENDSGFEIVNHTGDEIRQLGVSLVSLVRLSGGSESDEPEDAGIAPLLLEWKGKERSASDVFDRSQVRLFKSESRFIKLCSGSSSRISLAVSDPESRRSLEAAGGWTWRFSLRVSSDSFQPRLVHGYELKIEWDQSRESWYGVIDPDRSHELVL